MRNASAVLWLPPIIFKSLAAAAYSLSRPYAGRLFRQTKKVTIGVSMGLVIGWFMSAYQIAQERGLVTLVVAKMGFA